MINQATTPYVGFIRLSSGGGSFKTDAEARAAPDVALEADRATRE
jgi:hypothetical protein